MGVWLRTHIECCKHLSIISDVIVSADALFQSVVMYANDKLSAINTIHLALQQFCKEKRWVPMRRELFLAHHITQLALVAGSELIEKRRAPAACKFYQIIKRYREEDEDKDTEMILLLLLVRSVCAISEIRCCAYVQLLEHATAPQFPKTRYSAVYVSTASDSANSVGVVTFFRSIHEHIYPQHFLNDHLFLLL